MDYFHSNEPDWHYSGLHILHPSDSIGCIA